MAPRVLSPRRRFTSKRTLTRPLKLQRMILCIESISMD